MGNILNIGCSSCKYSNEYFLGTGDFFRERNIKSVAIVNKIAGIDISRILIVNSFVQVFRCFGCNGLFNKMYISYKVKDSLSLQYSILYECNKCREPLYPLFSDGILCTHQLNHQKEKNTDEPELRADYELYYYEKVLNDIPCYKCGNRKLHLNAWGEFD